MRVKLQEHEKKDKFCVSINRELSIIVNKRHKNKSKYIEHLIYMDLLKNKLVEENMML
jgi:hypothetical protein